MKDQEAEFYNQLAELSESLEFKVADFERFVDTVRETASRHLHTLVLVNADLRGVCILIQRGLNRWSNNSEQKLGFLSKVKI